MEDKEILILHLDGNGSDQAEMASNRNLFIGKDLHQSQKCKRLHRVQRSFMSCPYHWARVHCKPLIAALLTTISSTSILILFPEYLELITKNPSDKSAAPSDGYSVSLVLTTISTMIFLLVGIILEFKRLIFKNNNQYSIFYPEVSRASVFKIGISTGLSLLTLCYAWEDHKVRCNMQLPLLGLVFLFASITQSLCHWRCDHGYRKSFGMLAVIGGVFISVDFSLVDHERCRGVHPPPKDMWTWKVHLVWTLAFVVAIWLWTITVFVLESAIPLESNIRRNIPESGICLQIIKSSSSFKPISEAFPDDETSRIPDVDCKTSLISVFKGLLWFHVATWTVVLSLFWTEFVPGFGKVLPEDNYSIAYSFETAVRNSFGSDKFWILLASAFIFAHAFTYLLISVGSPLVAIGFKCIGFPCVSLCWSLFQIQSPYLLWMPMATELICALIGFPLIVCGTLYLYILDCRARKKSLLSHLSVYVSK